MTDLSKATPRPWVQFLDNEAKMVWLIPAHSLGTTGVTISIATDEGDANAMLIALAVNCYDDLIAALREIADNRQFDDPVSHANFAMSRARAALERAGPMMDAREFVRRAHVALHQACETGSMMAMHLIDDAQELLDEAALALPNLAEQASALAQECRETLRGALGYVVTLESKASDLLKAIDAARLGEAA